jgi:hypothetical protein
MSAPPAAVLPPPPPTKTTSSSHVKAAKAAKKKTSKSSPVIDGPLKGLVFALASGIPFSKLGFSVWGAFVREKGGKLIHAADAKLDVTDGGAVTHGKEVARSHHSVPIDVCIQLSPLCASLYCFC